MGIDLLPHALRIQSLGHMQMSMRNPDADPHLYKIYFTILNK